MAAGQEYPAARVVGRLEDIDTSGFHWGSVVAVIATWGPSHADLFHALADRGVRRILCEKPLASSVADAYAMVERANRERIALSVHHYLRYGGLVPALRSLFAEHELGAPVSVVVTGGASCLVTNGIHWLDFASELFGSAPRSVIGTVQGQPINPRSPDLEIYGGAAVWDFGDGREAAMALSNQSSLSLEARVYLRDAVVVLDGNLNGRLLRRDPVAVTRFPAITRTGSADQVLFEGTLPGALSYLEGMRRAIEEVRLGMFPICPAELGATAVSGCIGALVASRERRQVFLPLDPSSVCGKERWAIS